MNKILGTNGARVDLGEMNDLEAVDQLVEVRGLDLIDAGCAGGQTTRALAERGATVLGVEPDPIQARHNLALAPIPGLTFIEAGAEELPAGDFTVDGVFLFRSLHHVPIGSMDRALEEAARVLRPGGFLYVAEPALACTFFRLMQPFHDEGEVRTHAQQALERAAGTLFQETTKFRCVQRPQFANFEALIDRFTGMSFNHITRKMIDTPAVKDCFDAGRTGDQYVFEQPMLINLYRKARA